MWNIYFSFIELDTISNHSIYFFSCFSTKTYVVSIRIYFSWSGYVSALNTCYHGDIRKLFSLYPVLSSAMKYPLYITKTRLYNFDPLKPHIYIVKLGFTGVYIIFPFLLKNIDCGYSLEPPRQGRSNEYPQSMFWAEMWKILEIFIWFFFFSFFPNFLYIWIGVFS